MMIDNQARTEVQKNVKNALDAMWEHIEKNGLQQECQDHYSFLYKFLDEMDSWPSSEGEAANAPQQVVINGTLYTPRGE